MPYGDQWRQHRKICQQNFNADAAKRYYPIQSGQVEMFLKHLLREPEKAFDHITLSVVSYKAIFELVPLTSHSPRLSISATMLMMYGYAPETVKDPVIQAADESTKLATILFDSGGTLINMFPFLYYIPAWMPGTNGKRMIEKVKQLTRDARRIPIEHVTAAMVS